MDNQYTSFKNSAENFIKKFGSVKDKKIVLYGIGQYTATLIPMLDGFHIVGLLDGDSDNIGKVLYGIKVLSIEEAKKNADIIIINTSSFYWNMIYERISDIGIPVYYADGNMATGKGSQVKILSDEERHISVDSIKKEIDKVEIVSFDLYDTLLMRLVCNTSDVFKLVELQLELYLRKRTHFQEKRNEAIGKIEKVNYSLNDLYMKIHELYPDDDVQLYQRLEIETEKAVTVPRKDVVDIYQYAVEQGKDIYILSDMYLSSDFLQELLKLSGIEIDKEHLWISCEKGATKYNSELWNQYNRKIVRGRKALHIGDNMKADITEAKKYGLVTIKIASASTMMEEFLTTKIWGKITSLYASLTTGILMNELFNSPFVWNAMNDVYYIQNCRKFGKKVFGNIILTYLLWIVKKSEDMRIQKLVFLARDGYFLKQDYLELVSRLRLYSAPCAEYMLTSRKAVLLGAADKYDEAFSKLMEFSYSGTFKDYLSDRFDIQALQNDKNIFEWCQLPQEKKKIKEWLGAYGDDIKQHISSHARKYGSYVNEYFDLQEMAIVDICYTGTIQYWLSKMIGKKITGFYFVADVSDNNIYKQDNPMFVCYQGENDKMAANSYVWKNHKIIESFLTAPYGMMKYMDSSGEVVTFDNGKNQQHYAERELMNQGCIDFISEYVHLLEQLSVPICDLVSAITIDPLFIDKLFGIWFTNNVTYSENIKKCFWHEDDFISSAKEYSLF